MIVAYTNVNQRQVAILEKYLPGPFTFVLPVKNSEQYSQYIKDKCFNYDNEMHDYTIGVRILNDDFCNLLLDIVNQPIIATSSNISGQNAPYLLKDIDLEVKSQINVILENEVKYVSSGTSSTLIDITKEKNIVLRQGLGIFEE